MFLKDLSRTQVRIRKGCAYRNEATSRRFWRKRKSTTRRFATARVPERFFSVGKDQFNYCDFFFLDWKLGPLFVFVLIQRMFSSWVYQRTLGLLFKDCWSFYFHSLKNSTFLVSRGCCVYIINKKYMVACRYEISLTMLNSTSHLRRNLSSTRRKSAGGKSFSCWFSFSAGL